MKSIAKTLLVATTLSCPLTAYPYVTIDSYYSEKGKEVFNSKGNCYKCHSINEPSSTPKNNLLETLLLRGAAGFPTKFQDGSEVIYENQEELAKKYIFFFISYSRLFNNQVVDHSYFGKLKNEEISQLTEYIFDEYSKQPLPKEVKQ